VPNRPVMTDDAARVNASRCSLPRSPAVIVASGLHPYSAYGVRALLETTDEEINILVEDDLSQLSVTVDQHAAVAALIDVDGDRDKVVCGLQAFRQSAPQLPLGFISGGLEREGIPQLLAYSPHAVLSKALEAHELGASIRLMLLGHLVFGSEVIDHVREGRIEPKVRPNLDRRERQLLSHLMDGLDNCDIAAAMFLSRAAVKRSVQSVLSKLGVHNRTQAAVWAAKHWPGLAREGSDKRENQPATA